MSVTVSVGFALHVEIRVFQCYAPELFQTHWLWLRDTEWRIDALNRESHKQSLLRETAWVWLSTRQKSVPVSIHSLQHVFEARLRFGTRRQSHRSRHVL